ncbi:MAG: GntR family transcriptional regulator [Gammaproteobacteria bacterium]|nr:GntR family transcriptional regulator [Gammaproteobacteria bacterium]
MPTKDRPGTNSYTEDEVLRLIEQAILDHKLAPGTKLKEVQLAQVFGVKRGTIRKVLARLVNSRLASQQPNRGATVARPSAKEGRDLFATRRAIERAIIEELVRLDDPSHIPQLRQILDMEHKAYQSKDNKHALQLSVEFHRQLAIMAGNGVMCEILEDIIRRTPLVILTHLGTERENSCRNHEHEAIVDAIENRDARKAGIIMKEHLLHIENQIHHKTDEAEPDLATLLLSS